MPESNIYDRPGDPDFMTSLARGLAVMKCVAEAEQPVTIAQVGRLTGLSRASVRRCLHTLLLLGYVGQDERGYAVRRQALSLGHPYLSLNALAARAQPLLDTLRDSLHESCSLGVMEDDQLLYMSRAEAIRIMSINLRVGSRLPLHATSMGRVLLAGQPHAVQEAYLARTTREKFTAKTIVDRAELLIELSGVASRGYAVVDEELEVGLRSIAVPVARHGKVVAALNVGTAAARKSVVDLRDMVLPALQEAATILST